VRRGFRALTLSRKETLMAGAKKPVAISLGVVFSLVSAFHVVGVFGAWDDLPVLPVTPDTPAPRASPISWLFVAAALAFATMIVLARGDMLLTSLPSRLTTLACAVLGAIFVLRSIGEFQMFGFFRKVSGTDFAFWDTWLYTPLALMLGLGALWLAITPRNR